jgi:hypothetical protein
MRFGITSSCSFMLVSFFRVLSSHPVPATRRPFYAKNMPTPTADADASRSLQISEQLSHHSQTRVGELHPPPAFSDGPTAFRLRGRPRGYAGTKSSYGSIRACAVGQRPAMCGRWVVRQLSRSNVLSPSLTAAQNSRHDQLHSSPLPRFLCIVSPAPVIADAVRRNADNNSLHSVTLPS